MRDQFVWPTETEQDEGLTVLWYTSINLGNPTPRNFRIWVKKSEIIRLKQVDHIMSEKAILQAINHPMIISLYTTMSIFKDDTIYVVMWVESLGISLVQGWFFQDPFVIIVRNNIQFTKKRIRSHRYQVIEKFVLAPCGACWKIVNKNLLAD